MNNKGQTLVIFIILLPVVLGMCAFVFDIGIVKYENNKVKNVTKSIFIDSKNLDEDKIIYLYKSNDINIDNLKLEFQDNFIKVNNNYNIDSIFAKVFQINKFEVRLNAKYDIDNNKLEFEE